MKICAAYMEGGPYVQMGQIDLFTIMKDYIGSFREWVILENRETDAKERYPTLPEHV